jgi:hypothetical protein
VSAPNVKMDQPTMAEMRARLRDADLLAELERKIAELHARDCHFPSLSDSDVPELHRRFAGAVMTLVRGVVIPTTINRLAADSLLGEYHNPDTTL